MKSFSILISLMLIVLCAVPCGDVWSCGCGRKSCSCG